MAGIIKHFTHQFAFMLSVEETAPEFELPGTDGEGIQPYSLSDFIEEGMVVLSFYPFDFSPTCSTQLCEFRDAEFLSFTKGVDVVGISVDSAYCHQAFIETYDLNFPLLSDRLAEVADQYGFRAEKVDGHPHVCQRGLVAVDSSQTVRYTWKAETNGETPDLTELEESIEWFREEDDQVYEE
jgi:peroxiredoxin